MLKSILQCICYNYPVTVHSQNPYILKSILQCICYYTYCKYHSRYHYNYCTGPKRRVLNPARGRVHHSELCPSTSPVRVGTTHSMRRIVVLETTHVARDSVGWALVVYGTIQYT